MASIKTLLSRKKAVAPACMMPLTMDGESGATHTNTCFAALTPLSVVELFQSQGCRSCPPAAPLVHDAVASDPNLLLLTYDVTYWDAAAGWTDTFGSAQWDGRQRAYVARWARAGIFTPQVVVDGVADGVGARQGEVQEIVGKATQARGEMAWAVGLERVDAAVRIASDRAEAEAHEVLIVKYDPRLVEVKVGKGPNKGKKMQHRNVARELMKLGEWRGGETVIRLPEAALVHDRFERVILLQATAGGPIVAALKL